MHSILWSRLDRAGHEAARLRDDGAVNELTGCAVFIEGALPVRLDYRIVCGADWTTRRATVRGWVGDRDIDIDVIPTLSEAKGRNLGGRGRTSWTMNGAPVPAVTGCIDVDLNFSPSTNLLPVRRLDLQIGESAEVRAAWLRFPSFRLEPLEQTYHRLAPDLYRYESNGGRFQAELRVDEHGFPVEYAGVWRAI